MGYHKEKNLAAEKDRYLMEEVILRDLYKDLPVHSEGAVGSPKSRYIKKPMPGPDAITLMDTSEHFRLTRYFRQDLHRIMLAHTQRIMDSTPTPVPLTEELIRRIEGGLAATELSENLAQRLRNAGYTSFVDAIFKTKRELYAESMHVWKHLVANPKETIGYDHTIIGSYISIDNVVAEAHGDDEMTMAYTFDALSEPTALFGIQLTIVAGRMILDAEKKLGRKVSADDMKTVLRETEKILFAKAALSKSEFWGYMKACLSEKESPFSIVVGGDKILAIRSAKEKSAAADQVETFNLGTAEVSVKRCPVHDLSIKGCPALGVSHNGENIIHSRFDRFAQNILGIEKQQSRSQEI